VSRQSNSATKIEITARKLSIGTVHLANGLEFGAVAVMACDDEIIHRKSASRMSPIMPIYDSERQPALRRLHARPRSSFGNRRQASIRVS
jgi:hypothetical protein